MKTTPRRLVMGLVAAAILPALAQIAAWFKTGCFWVTNGSVRLMRAGAQDFEHGLARFEVVKPRA